MRPSARALLAQADLPALLVTDLVNIRYLTGLSLSSGTLLVLPRGYLLCVDPRYEELARDKAYPGVAVRYVDALAKLLQKIPTCGFEEQQVTVARATRWKKTFKNTKFVQSGQMVEECRRQKDEEELRLMRRAERMTQELLRRVPTALRRNVTEKALAWKLAQWAQELGADRLAFDPIVAFGTHTSRPHHQPTTRALQKGHLVQIDVGAVYRGYCADMSRVFFTAKPTAEQERAYRAVMEAKETAQAAIRAGVSTKELDQQARGVLRSYGMEAAFTHALGHGLGLEVHEGVTVSSHAPLRTLVPGEVITVEPGVYFPGKFGIRIEDMAVVE